MLVALGVRTAVIERRVGGRKPYLLFDTVVMVMVEGRAQKVQRHHEHEQPTREPPCAAHTVGGTARKG